jgi:O-antigen/teichoic acid export membrane protein
VTDAPDPGIWGRRDAAFATVARNVGMRYTVIISDTLIGLLLLPFNVGHLGKAAYGLWLLTASLTAYFSILDLGYGGALVRFVARYRALRDARALNEVLSTLFIVFAVIGVVTYGGLALIADHLGRVFAIGPDQAAVGASILRIVALHVALSFPFSVYGSVVNGFQRYDANCFVALGTGVIVALVNVAVLSAGYDLVTLVTATTAVRLIGLCIYRQNAYRIFPALQVRPSHFRIARLREVSGFSVYNLLIDWGNKLNYHVDPIVVGAFLGSAPVAVWGVAQRITQATQRLTNQINTVLFPVVVDSDAVENRKRLRRILIEGTRISIALVLPITMALVLLADPLVRAWVGPGFEGSVLLVQLLSATVAIRVANATATTVLKGAGRHRYVALINLVTGLVNVILSVVLIRLLGLMGVALATLVPVGVAAIVFHFPAACRRVGLPLRTAIASAIWPATWPAASIVLILVALRGLVPPGAPTLTAVGLQTGIGLVAYYAIFALLAIRREERQHYVAKARQLLTRRVPAAA